MQMMSEFTKEIIEKIKSLNSTPADDELQSNESYQYVPPPVTTITGAIGSASPATSTVNITTGGTGYTNVMPGGGGGAGNYYINNSGIGTGGVSSWGTINPHTNLRITGKNPVLSTDKSAINLDELAEMMKVMRERLLILIPDFEKHEKYIALKKAYDHYKLIEAMLKEEKKDE
jgi:hypothetical protein